MKIEIPKIVRPVDMGEYAEEMRGQLLYVWVNPPTALMDEYFRLRKDLLETDDEINKLAEKSGSPAGKTPQNNAGQAPADDEKINGLVKAIESQAAGMRDVLAQLLSQGPEALRWTSEDVAALLTETADSDPQLYPWVVNAIFEQIGEHRARRKKD